MQLVQLQQNLASLRAHGAAVVAASLDPVSTSVGLARRLHLTFPILQDDAHGLGAAFGDYQNLGLRGQDGDAIVVLDSQGHMRWRRYSAGLPVPTSEVLAALARV